MSSSELLRNNNTDITPKDNDDDDMADMKKKTSDSPASRAAAGFKFILLVLMVLQNSSTVLVGRHTRTAVTDKKDLYVVNHLILVTEVAKFLLSCVLEYTSTNGRLIQSFMDHVVHDPIDALKILVPALLYLVQNSLLYIALSNLTAPIFQVTYQGKLVTTAIVSVIMLQRSYNMKQWICLIVLSLGVAIVVLGEDSSKKKTDDDSNKPAQSLAVGLVAVSIACLSSALAGVYFEYMVKTVSPAKSTAASDAGGNNSNTNSGNNSSGSSSSNNNNTNNAAPRQPVSLWMRNMQLAFFSIVIAMAQNFYDERIKKRPNTEAEALPYFHGFTAWVWVLVALQAGGGLLVAAVIKYADNVLKGLATGVSVVVATLCSMVLFGTPLSGQFSFGATLILISVYLFSNDIPAFVRNVTGGRDRSSTELKPILPK